MANVGDLKSRAQGWAIDPSAAAIARVADFVDEAHAWVQRRGPWSFHETGEDVFVTSPGVRVLGTIAYDVFLAPDDEPWWVDGHGKIRRKPPMGWLASRSEITKRYNPDDPDEDGAPAHIYLRPDNANLRYDVEVYPLPDALNPVGDVFTDGNYRVHVPYWKLIPLDKMDNNDSTIVTNDEVLAMAVEFKAAALLCSFDESLEREARMEARAVGYVREKLRHEKRARLRRAGALATRRDVHAPRNQGH